MPWLRRRFAVANAAASRCPPPKFATQTLTPAFYARLRGLWRGSASFATRARSFASLTRAPRGVNLLFSYKLRLGREGTGETITL